MFNVGIARLSELSASAARRRGWRRAQLGGPPVEHPGTRRGPRAGGGTGRVPRSSPRRRSAPGAAILYRSAAGKSRGSSGGEGTGTFPRCVSPSGCPCPPFRAAAAVPGAGAAPGALPQLRRAGAGSALPAGPGLLRRSPRGQKCV